MESLELYYKEIEVEKRKRRIKKRAHKLAERLRFKLIMEQAVESPELTNHEVEGILRGIIKGNNAYATVYYISEFLEANLLYFSVSDVVDLAKECKDPFMKFVVARVLRERGYEYCEVVADYLDYVIEPLEYGHEFEKSLADEYVWSAFGENGEGLKPNFIERDLQDAADACKNHEDVYAFVNKLHRMDVDDRYTSKIVKQRILKRGQKLR